MTRMVHPNGPGAEQELVMCSVCRSILFERDYEDHLGWHKTLARAASMSEQGVLSRHRQKSSFGDAYCAWDNEDWPCSIVRALEES